MSKIVLWPKFIFEKMSIKLDILSFKHILLSSIIDIFKFLNSNIMASKMLLPHHFSRIGWFLAVPFLIWGIGYLVAETTFQLDVLLLTFGETDKAASSNENFFFNLRSNNFTDELIAVGLMAGLILIGFSKEEIEDEWVAKLRLDALLWGVFINALLLLVAFIVLYNNGFWFFMNINLFTPLLIFIIRFNYLKWKENRLLA
jgi:hypothetical protein